MRPTRRSRYQIYFKRAIADELPEDVAIEGAAYLQDVNAYLLGAQVFAGE